MKFIGKMILGTVIVIVTLVVILTMCVAAASQPQVATPTPTVEQSLLPPASSVPTHTVSSVNLDGPGSMKTAEFPLTGNYVVTWTSVGGQSDVFGAFLYARSDPGYAESIGLFQAKGTTNLYDVPEGMYYLDVNSTSAWSVTFTPVAP